MIHFHKFAALACMLLLIAPAWAEVPEWVGSRPALEGYYTGIGTAPSSDKNRDEKAKAAALSDLIRDISVSVSADMKQNAVQKNEDYSEEFSMEVQSHSDAYLEGHELVGTYDDGTDYWCFYKLSRKKYEEVLARRMSEAASKGYDYGCRASEATSRGDLKGALSLYAEGLETVAPFRGRNLIYNGQSVENMLQHSLAALFSGLSLSLEPNRIDAVPMSAETYPVSVRLMCGSAPVGGIPVKVRFTQGEGKITPPAATSAEGLSTFSVSDIVSRDPVQIVTASADFSGLITQYKGRIRELMERSLVKSPEALLTINVKTPSLKAWCRYKNDYDDPALLRAISSYLSANYFDMAQDAASADVLVDVTVDFRPGGIVKGDMYDMKEGFISSKVEVTDKSAGRVVATFGVDDVRTLAPEKNADAKLKKQAARELLRKLKPEMKRRMASTRFTRKELESVSDEED